MATKQHSIPPSLAWLTVFIPALAYFLGSRLSETRLSGRSLGNMVQNRVNHLNGTTKAKQALYLDGSNNALLKQGLYLVQSKGLDSIVDLQWKHDDELGRGFLLLSQSSFTGRIWRWEVGGGPIAIGKTLHMEPSGCRSNVLHNCTSGGQYGSGGLALDFSSHDTSYEGRLVVSEWGEQRIVRMEESGARTPLVLQVPSLCQENTMRRIHQPNSLLYTTFGDLILADYDVECQMAGLYYLDNAMTIPPLASALESRKAHSWTSIQNHEKAVRVFYSQTEVTAVGGLALDSTWTGLYAMLQLQREEGPVVQLMHLYLNDDDDEPLWNGASEVVHEWESTQKPGPVAVDQKGTLFVGVDEELVVFVNGKPVATIALPERATALAIGQDSYLYVSTASDLYRMKVRNQPLKIPTNLVVKKKK